MDTIVTPVTVITLDSTRIVHSIKTDLVARYFPPVVRLVQYDQSLPVIAVSLMQNGQTYTLPSGAAANIRVHKPDATYVYNPALGCDSTRKIVYFEVTQAMAAANGDGLAIVEIVVDGDIAGTSLITLHFEENPVPEDAIESSDEWETIYELGERIIASTVTPVSTAAGMTDHNVVYLYTGTESGWNQGHMYYYNGTTWVDAGIAVTDTTLSVAGLAADAKKTGDEIADLKDGLQDIEEEISHLDGLSEDVKQALLQIASKVAYIDEDGQDYYDALNNALYPPADLVSISAVYTQSGTVYDTDSLDSLKSDLVVTALYDDQTTETVTTYTLSGTLAEGTSTITVSYGGKTDTFDVVVVHAELPSGYTKYDYLTQTGFSGNYQAKAYGIWTNAQMSTDYTLEMKFFASSSTGSTDMVSPPLIGTRGGASGTKEIALFYKPRHKQLGYWFDGTDSTNQPPAPSKNVLHTIKIKPVGASTTYPNNVTIDIDGTEYNTGSASTGKTFDSWFGIFTYAISSNMGITNNDVIFAGQQIGEILVTDSNGDAVYDFVPAKDSSDRYGYYEKVGGVFYYNATYAATKYIGGYWE